MSRFFQAASYGGLFAILGGSIYLLFSVASAITQHSDLIQTFFNCLIAAAVSWLLLTCIFYKILGKVARYNQQARDRFNDQNKP